MFRRRLGRSGIQVSALGLGCMEIGGKMKDDERYLLDASANEKQPILFLGDVDDAQSIRTIHHALDAGIDFFDTAPAYGAGHSERLLGRALAARRDQAVIATKFGKPIDEADNRFGRYANERDLIGNIRMECEDSLRRLETDYIDLYQYHQMHFTLTEFAAEVIEILESLVTEGKIRFYGWSTNDPDCARVFARGAHCTAIQHGLNVIWDAPERLAVCNEFDQASIARGILGMGALTGKYTLENYKSLLSAEDFRSRNDSFFISVLEKLEKVRDILTSDGRTLSQGALAWVWARSDRTIPLTGFRTSAQVEENIAGCDFGPLTVEQMQQIELLLERVPT
ncbi:MAG: aldo/keto reductase [Chloroflexi bacterium]|nr:aldo/keto reductase [Chloroflexota bacterium]